MQILLYGAGAFGREVAWLVQCINKHSREFEVLGFIDDSDLLIGREMHGLEILSMDSAAIRFPDARLVCCVAQPGVRAAMVKNTSQRRFQFATMISPAVEVSETSSVDYGSILCVGTALTTDVKIGRHVQINMHCSIGHDVTIGDCTTLGPGVHVAGHVIIGQRVFIGGGCVITNGTEHHPIVLGDDAFIGAGSCVLRSVTPGTKVFGVPARPVPVEAIP